ncbi:MULTISPECIES: inositol monophosphatase family protein [unclassified Microcoleus]|uniref:3'(2'),5'-bisphosphate nucleotidase CysQ family protein n=1 Tax=unclassified Microcoleus TaxID=2642155 RepID=UPI001D69C630|nr:MULTISPECIES: inositol monophosphatase family protein [unclassified Microcoleus]TAF92201.1 MAG: 3'(2'),5'-bisphosphate nucleotidase CysQ [Oscillatoriales cyanobacterium]MCC3435631.1 3'(2'),5'-bisphosphate nucleotidase CysQ [Microcoleus sp. PH2017_05_CCC_O_A]MCC3449136.1 3'(2'),5'-bisphosphate nucleotidase CysQ [Microcoleus sp. PH2017_09_SFU_O_A]MCC3630155.1 3'(2'),5'-bisphosphate nucleotidase CysQ [Microcoleus sp. PH2017_39_LGB_O_B]MCC3642129.1 3'(2'),5'-bisphosphate nucleotidase CysQ [Micr
MKNLEQLSEIAQAAAWGAADILQSYYRPDANTPNLDIQEQKDGPVTAADVAVNSYILDELQSVLGNAEFGYLSEETYKSYLESCGKVPLPQSWVWIIDPLDGTRDFIDKTGEFAVHIALAFEGKPMLAVVAWPSKQKIYYAIRDAGAFGESRGGCAVKLQVSARNIVADLSIVTSRSHRDDRLNRLLHKFPCQNQLAVGSIGCKIATIVEQKADVYIALSGKSAPKDWDLAAPELILTEAGGRFTRFDGSALQYNRGDVSQWGGLLASNGCCHDALCGDAEAILAEIDSGLR